MGHPREQENKAEKEGNSISLSASAIPKKETGHIRRDDRTWSKMHIHMECHSDDASKKRNDL